MQCYKCGTRSKTRRYSKITVLGIDHTICNKCAQIFYEILTMNEDNPIHLEDRRLIKVLRGFLAN